MTGPPRPDAEAPGRRFLVVGLTGGIATGKSTVSAIFRALGCIVIDADVLARDVVELGEPAYRTIVAEFGGGVLQPDGALDRKKLGAIVFADPVRRKRLEAITHPAIRERFARRLAQLTEEGFTGIVIFDAPVMIESGNYKNMDRLVVVATDEATQRQRLVGRDGISAEEVERRIASQMSVAEKARLADYVIDNSGDRATTEVQTRLIHRALEQERRAAWVGAGHVVPLGVLFPIGMGIYGTNPLPVEPTFQRLRQQTCDVHFIGYHRRRSGNFVFEARGERILDRASREGERIIGLPCIARGFPDLARLEWGLPNGAESRQGPVVVGDGPRPRRVVAVMLSRSLEPTERPSGQVTGAIEVARWVSSADSVCFYDRPETGGALGKVSRAVARAASARGHIPHLNATARAMSVIRDILDASLEWYGGSTAAREVSVIRLAPRIVVDPKIRSGKPVIEGTRVPVDVVVGQVAAGIAVDDVAQEYGVARDDVLAALSYAARVVGGEEIRALD